MSDPTVVDLSHYQQNVDFAEMAASGVLAVILKCTEGSTYTDDTFQSNRDQAVAAGLPYSSYHFLKHDNATDQMSFYLDTLQPQPGERVCIDFEDAQCTLDDLHEAVQAIINYNNDTGMNLQITVYSGHLLNEQLNGEYDALLAESTSLWLAQYTTGTPSWPGGTYKTWSLWQYTDQARVGGYDGPVDGNRFNGSEQALFAWFGPASVAPVPEIPQIEIILRASSPVQISVVLDDNVTLI